MTLSQRLLSWISAAEGCSYKRKAKAAATKAKSAAVVVEFNRKNNDGYLPIGQTMMIHLRLPQEK